MPDIDYDTDTDVLYAYTSTEGGAVAFEAIDGVIIRVIPGNPPRIVGVTVIDFSKSFPDRSPADVANALIEQYGPVALAACGRTRRRVRATAAAATA